MDGNDLRSGYVDGNLIADLQRNYNFAFCWTSHGVVYLRRDENSPQIRVTNETDLEGLRKE
ncbi:hypothetical protein JYU34_006727 [Plutella xylostella]|uniref:FP protein C-terminal domain-containing protein n=1 Tax=Plutella xylostella TaxID=51655 RepID=A0ABQ7QSS6_PLUXY|nr:hypothetical protein JYU34_006727 [Plutella xylostella]